MRFEFASAGRIIFGPGTVREIGSLIPGFGRHPLVVTGKETARAAPVTNQLLELGLAFELLRVPGEPTMESVRAGVEQAQGAGCDMVLAIGGGSVIDTGKIVAAMLTNRGDLVDYLEVIGRGQKLNTSSAPFLAIPTTAGTGAEVTKNAVLTSREHRVKVSMRSRFMLPRLAIVDPELTHSLPPEVTASTGLDALTQLLEAFVSRKANPLTDGICREGIKRAARSLPIVYENGSHVQAREEMALASLFSGLVLANAGLGAVHGFAGPIGGLYSAPHGAICACLLPIVVEMNVRALKSRNPDSPTLAKYDEVAQLLLGTPTARAEDGILWLHELRTRLKIPSLRQFGIDKANLSGLIAGAKKASSMKGNPISLQEDELMEIVEQAL